MDGATQVLCEMHQYMWDRLSDALADLGDEEINWRPLPHGNSINIIVRHLRIEAQWHLDSLRHGEAMPSDVAPELRQEIDAVPLDYRANRIKLEELYTGFLDTLRMTTQQGIEQRTATAYQSTGDVTGPAHLLGYHQALHIATHCGQIRTIRNLYRRGRGEPERFFPDNPTYPR
jgi:hypothetical protein